MNPKGIYFQLFEDLANFLALILLKKISVKSISVLSFIFLKNQCDRSADSSWHQLNAARCT